MVRLLVICGVFLAATITVGTALILSNLREHAIADRERELQNIALVLAAQTDRAFQALDLVQASLIERMQTLGVASGKDYQRQMSGHDVHLTLKDKIGSLPHVDAIAMINAQGKLINFSRSWPIPEVDVSDKDYFKVLQSGSELTSFLSEPVRNPGTGAWTINVARKFVGPNGELLGVVLGIVDLEYFEKLFGTLVLGDDSAIALYRRDGVLLVRYPQRDSPGHSYARSDFFTKILPHADRGVLRLTSPIDGTKRLVAGRSLAHYPIVVGVGTSVRAALAGWRSATIYMTGTAGLLILVICVTILLSVRQIKNYELLVKARAEKDQKVQLDAALNNMRQGLQMYNAKGRVIVNNRKYLEMYGLSPDAVKPGWTLRDVLHLRKAAGTLAEDPDEFLKAIDHGKVQTRVVQLPDGRTISVTNTPVPGGGWVSTHDDITERRRLERERDRSQIFLNAVVENVPVTIFAKEAGERRYVWVNRAAEQLWGVGRDRVIGKTAYDVFPKPTADLITARDDELLKHKHQIFHTTHQVEMPGNGARLVTSKRLAILGDDAEPQYLIGVVEDVTERARSEERIVHLAHHDMLTDLPNRLLFTERLEQALARVHRGERLAVLYLDLDHFKRINDTLGHPIGDELLKAVADRLRGCVREIDSIARLGGDEFAVVQTSLEQPSDAAALATRIREAIKAPYVLNGHQVEVDVSIGIAIAPNDGTDRDQLLKNADMALYGGKAAGRGLDCFFEPEMNERMKARHELERDLRKALVGGEFELYYQPLVILEDNEISGVEALLRWHHPERGMIHPTDFIPVAEESGLIIPLGEWVLRTACADASTWPDNINISVNLSPAQLTNDLVQVAISTLAASGLPARRLEFEITESVLIRNTFATLNTLHQLRELGVRIAMDDFGVGYSSLSYLLSFPFDKIKIDRSFINGLTDGDNSPAIVRAVTSLASSLNMTTIAEGVETRQQWEMVKALGCTEMQGYFFSPPRRAAEISRLFLSPPERTASAA